jgi:hypothetical protein
LFAEVEYFVDFIEWGCVEVLLGFILAVRPIIIARNFTYAGAVVVFVVIFIFRDGPSFEVYFSLLWSLGLCASFDTDFY